MVKLRATLDGWILLTNRVIRRYVPRVKIRRGAKKNTYEIIAVSNKFNNNQTARSFLFFRFGKRLDGEIVILTDSEEIRRRLL